MEQTEVSKVGRSGGWDLSLFLLLERQAGEGGRQEGHGSRGITSR
jgi:hypothetical protein